MEYTTLGTTGMDVSRICLGGASFGTSPIREWVLDEEASREIIEHAIDLGINFIDTSNVYSFGESERIIGNVLAEYDRDEFVITSKVYRPMSEDAPNSGGLSRKAIEQELDATLERLGLDTLDLYEIHRWDDNTPIEVTLQALDDAVRRGKIRYTGACSTRTYQLAKALHMSYDLGLEPFSVMQNHYNLVYREEEREMLPFCAEEEIAVTPWSPLARGFLTRPHEALDSTDRGTVDDLLYDRPYLQGGGVEINERVEELATERDVSMAQLSLAWLLHEEWVDAPILGTTSVEHLDDAVEALSISLSESDISYLEEPYEPVAESGLE
jgi:aryl-alcohol dehydrogenase-like predicted oxidoreductase